jgi:hypothetical protein
MFLGSTQKNCTVHGSLNILNFLHLELQFRHSGESRNPVSFRLVRPSGCRIESGMTRELWTLESKSTLKKSTQNSALNLSVFEGNHSPVDRKPPKTTTYGQTGQLRQLERVSREAD